MNSYICFALFCLIKVLCAQNTGTENEACQGAHEAMKACIEPQLQAAGIPTREERRAQHQAVKEQCFGEVCPTVQVPNIDRETTDRETAHAQWEAFHEECLRDSGLSSERDLRDEVRACFQEQRQSQTQNQDKQQIRQIIEGIRDTCSAQVFPDGNPPEGCRGPRGHGGPGGRRGGRRGGRGNQNGSQENTGFPQGIPNSQGNQAQDQDRFAPNRAGRFGQGNQQQQSYGRWNQGK